MSPRCADGRPSTLPWEAVADAERAVAAFLTSPDIGESTLAAALRLWPPADQPPLPFPL